MVGFTFQALRSFSHLGFRALEKEVLHHFFLLHSERHG